jgi:hypothetical protein
MGKKTFRVRFDCDGYAVIELDDAVIEAVDDEFRRYLYPLYTAEDVARHVCANLVLNNARLSQLDGWADQSDSNAIVIEEPEFFVTDYD